MDIDEVDRVKPNSVLLDNTTLFTCLPMYPDAESGGSYHWATKNWAKDLIDRGMANLIEALILHEAVYVDGESRYQAPIVEKLAELFPELIRGVGVGSARETVFEQLSSMLSETEGLDGSLYLIASHAARSDYTGEPLHLEYCYEFTLSEMTARRRDGYLPENRDIDPLVFRTFFYLGLSGLTKLPYTPYPLRNPILLALSEEALPAVAAGHGRHSTSEYYARIAHDLLESFDQHVREAVSTRIQSDPARLPALPMPTFWEFIKQQAGTDRRALADQTRRLRDQAQPYREYVGQLAKAYESGDVEFLRRQHELLGELVNELSSTMRLPPGIHWKRVVVPIKLTLPFVGLEQLSLWLPTRTNLRKPHFIFLHDWASRRF